MIPVEFKNSAMKTAAECTNCPGVSSFSTTNSPCPVCLFTLLDVCSGSVVVTAYDSESDRPGSNPVWD